MSKENDPYPGGQHWLFKQRELTNLQATDPDSPTRRNPHQYGDGLQEYDFIPMYLGDIKGTREDPEGLVVQRMQTIQTQIEPNIWRTPKMV